MKQNKRLEHYVGSNIRNKIWYESFLNDKLGFNARVISLMIHVANINNTRHIINSSLSVRRRRYE